MLKNLLITGGAGFIGINATEEFLSSSPFEKLIILDDLKFGQNPEDVLIFQNPKINFVKGDIRNSFLVSNILEFSSTWSF